MTDLDGGWHAALRKALSAAQISDDELARRLDADLGHRPEWLTPALAGETRPSLAHYLLIFGVTDIDLPVLTGRAAAAESAFIALRSRTVDAADERVRRAEERGLRLIEQSRLLNSWLEEHTTRRAAMEHLRAMVSRDRYAAKAGQNTAANVRRALARRSEKYTVDGPIVDLVALVESCGVAVEFTDLLPQGVHGLTVQDSIRGGWDGVMLVNSTDFWVRQRYTLAHEFCHALFADDEHRFVNDDDTMESNVDAERRAESFARHFLAPQRELRRVWSSRFRSGRHGADAALCEVILHFGLSRAAAINALRNDNIVGPAEVGELREEGVSVRALMSRTGNVERWDAECLDQHDRGASALLLDAALGLYADGNVSADTVAAVLGQPVGQVRDDLARQGWTPRTQ